MPNSNVPGPPVGGTPKNNDIRGPNRKLTRRQEKFVKELVANDGLITLREGRAALVIPQGRRIVGRGN